MKREVWEFLREGKHPVVREWLETCRISPKDRAKLDFCLERLRTLDFALVSSKLMAGPLRGGTKLYKLRVRCQNRELRPYLCRGPFGENEYTLLQGAIEVGDSRLDPANAEERAVHNREVLLRNPIWRQLYE
jgi:hypothetical protein